MYLNTITIINTADNIAWLQLIIRIYYSSWDMSYLNCFVYRCIIIDFCGLCYPKKKKKNTRKPRNTTAEELVLFHIRVRRAETTWRTWSKNRFFLFFWLFSNCRKLPLWKMNRGERCRSNLENVTARHRLNASNPRCAHLNSCVVSHGCVCVFFFLFHPVIVWNK